ncbi:MAG TPA: glycosyltransferase [Actinospica sp.]|jgi:UDP:flavonoid glycosyltransferase YjiC (YdhE family)|nr:glycosyltransferase [Actinospica sp.]
MRILFSSTALAGHYGPLLPIARTCADLGHEVLFLVPPAARSAVEEAGFAVHEGAPPDPDEYRQIQDAIARDPGAAKVLMNRDYFGRLCTQATLPVAAELCASWKPDLVVHEACDYASPIAAHRAGIPHVQIAIGLAWIEWGCLHGYAAEVLPAFEPDAVRIIAEAPYVTRLPEGLDPSEFPRTVRYQVPEPPAAEPSADSAEGEFAADVYATLGSLAGNSQWSPGAYRVLLDACALLRRSRPEISVLLTTGRALDPATLGAVPGNVRVEQWVPQDRAFAAAKAVVQHGGSGTAYGALSAGLPSVFFPLFSDQPHNASLISAAGAGIQVDTEELREHGMPVAAEPADRARLAALAEEVAAALLAVLDDPSYAARAGELGAQLRAQPSLETVVGVWSANRALRSNI